MNSNACDREETVIAALRAGSLDQAARDHVAGCNDCALALEAERALHEVADAFRREARLAAPEVVLLRAKLRARREAAELSLRPLELWQRFAVVAIAAGLAVALLLFGPVFGALGDVRAGFEPAKAALALGVASLLALPFARQARRLA